MTAVAATKVLPEPLQERTATRRLRLMDRRIWACLPQSGVLRSRRTNYILRQVEWIDGPVAAFVGWDFEGRSFEGLRMAGRGRMRSPSAVLRIFNIRHVVPIGVGACALAGWFWAGFLVLGCYGLVGLIKGWMAVGLNI